ncbi:hypothetical protein Nmel_012711 [Mimus melanotis]
MMYKLNAKAWKIFKYLLSTRWSHLHRTFSTVGRSNTPSRRQGRIQEEMLETNHCNTDRKAGG